jgi:hypothetical protein
LEANPNTSITREDLYDQVWSQPLNKIALRFGVTSGDISKACAALNVPKPEQGHWTKVDLGKAAPVPLLPADDSLKTLTWTFTPRATSAAPRKPRVKSTFPRKRPKDRVFEDGEHPLLNGARRFITLARRYTDAGYYKPDKKLLVDIVVSKSGLDKALIMANSLFMALEAKSYPVEIQPHDDRRFHRAAVDIREVAPKKERNEHYWRENIWSPYRPTIVTIDDVEFGLTLFEMSELILVRRVNGDYVKESEYVPPKKSRYWRDDTWTTNKEYPSGRFCLQAYSRGGWIYQWRETSAHDLSSQIAEIIATLEASVDEVKHLIAEQKREEEEWHLKWEEERRLERIEAEKRRVANAIESSKKQLLEVVDQWGSAINLEQFFTQAKARCDDLPKEQQEKLLTQLALARELVGTINPLDFLMQWKSPQERLGTTHSEDDEVDDDCGGWGD